MADETKTKSFLFILSDNDPVLVRVLKNKFEKAAGWRSVIVTSYADAITAMHEAHPDAIMTEIILHDASGKTGFDLIAEAKQLAGGSSGIPIIIFTDLGQEEDKKKALSLGATHYFVKSEITINDLIKNISDIMASQSAR